MHKSIHIADYHLHQQQLTYIRTHIENRDVDTNEERCTSLLSFHWKAAVEDDMKRFRFCGRAKYFLRAGYEEL